MKTSGRIVICAALGLFAALPILVYSLAVRNRIADQARQLAHGRPYCILVTKNQTAYSRGIPITTVEYAEADSFMDTMGLFMMGGKARNHAVLVIGYRENEVDYHWSYWNFSFQKGALGPFRTNCAQYKFDYDSIQPSDYTETKRIRFNGTSYHIPLVYQPSASNDDQDRGGYAESFRVITTLPDFKPVKERCPEGICRLIRVTSAKKLTVDRKHPDKQRADAHYPRTLYGLETDVGSHDAGEFKTPGQFTPWGIYYKADKHGEVTTLLRCLSNCDVTFNAGGLQYSFYMRSENLRHWKQYEGRVLAFIGKFREKGVRTTKTINMFDEKGVKDEWHLLEKIGVREKDEQKGANKMGRR